jgi:hypothetical protein
MATIAARKMEKVQIGGEPPGPARVHGPLYRLRWTQPKVLCDNNPNGGHLVRERRQARRPARRSALRHALAIYPDFQAPRGGFNRSPTLFIGPSRQGTLEVIAIVTPPAGVYIFHVMPLRESTRNSIGYKEGEQP